MRHKNILVHFYLGYIFIASCSTNSQIKYITDLEQANIKSHVVKLITKTYKIDSTSGDEVLETKTVEIFDSHGFTIIDTSWNLIDKGEIINSLKFNMNGSLDSLQIFENKKKQSAMKVEYVGDRCIGMKVYDSLGKLDYYYGNISQNTNGLLLSADMYNSMGKLVASYKNEYNNIFRTKAIAKDSQGKNKSVIKIHLNKNNDPDSILDISYSNNSIDQKNTSYKYEVYDKSGNWLQQRSYNEKGKAINKVNRFFIYSN